ncbi:amidohydrolase [Weissella ceti]|uniref:Amidohydrolase n=1 Tax=Weissella ceti TaxID=759620 RepID=A0ABT3E4J0_9LACO|nr:amidohydrolase family protein [Weissella ceti]MCW0952843.1 amidohydrolase [Weissella ceti]QVK12540.1 amidohydrolase [Weissella ceti]
MKKIDGHLHLVRSIAGFNANGRLNPLGKGRAVWDTGEELQLIPEGYGDEAFLVEDAIKLMATGGVERAVLLQGSLNGYQNAYTYQVTQSYPERFVGAFAIDPYTHNVEQIVKHHVEDLGFRIMKLEMSEGGGLQGYHEAFNLAEMSVLQNVFAYLATYEGVTVVVDYGDGDQTSHQPESIVKLAELYPKMTFVVAHLSFPHVDQLEELQETLELFKPFNNIYLDLSAIQDIDDDTEYPFPKSQKVVQLAVDIVGSEKLIWGSDAPLSATFNPYESLANWLEDSGLFTKKQLEDMYFNTAETVYFKR